jgi:hypothetical protein
MREPLLAPSLAPAFARLEAVLASEAFAASVVTTLWDNAAVLHRSELVGAMTPGNPQFDAALANAVAAAGSLGGGEALLEIAADGVAEVADAGIGNEADDGKAFAAAADHACVGEGLDVAGDVGLGEAGGGDELGDILFAGFEGAEDFETAGFCERAEP